MCRTVGRRGVRGRVVADWWRVGRRQGGQGRRQLGIKQTPGRSGPPQTGDKTNARVVRAAANWGQNNRHTNYTGRYRIANDEMPCISTELTSEIYTNLASNDAYMKHI